MGCNAMEAKVMPTHRGTRLSPFAIGLAAAAGAVALGWVYLFLAGAPSRMLLLNPASLLVALAAVMVARSAAALGPQAGKLALMAMAGAIVATALFGQAADNVSRWVSIGGITLQPGLMLVPAIAVAFAAGRSRWAGSAVAIAALGLALQPDRAMAGALAASVAVTAVLRRDSLSLTVLGAALAAFITTLLRSDPLQAVPFVEGVMASAFAVGPVAGMCVLAGSALLLAPLHAASDPQTRPRLLAFAVLWSAVLAAAALGNYPTPLVGFGGSAIVGYLLSVAMLRLPARSAYASGAGEAARPRAANRSRQERLELA
jgi:hypothetical protein